MVSTLNLTFNINIYCCIFSSKNASCYMAGSLTKAGAGVAVIEYELAPKGKFGMLHSKRKLGTE